MRILRFALFAGALLFTTQPGALAAEDVPVEAFGWLPTIYGFKISPDGEKVAFFQKHEDDYVLVISRFSKEGLEPVNAIPPGNSSFNWVQWTNNDRLIVSFTGKTRIIRYGTLHARRLLAVNADGSNAVNLLEGKGFKQFRWNRDDLIHLLPNDPKHILVGFHKKEMLLSDVYRLNIYTNEAELVFKPEKGQRIHDWYADWDGNIRYGWGWDKKGRRLMLIRNADSDVWQPLHKNELFEDGRFSIMAFSYEKDKIFVLSSHINGRRALYNFDLNSGELAGKVFEHDTVDLDGLIMSRAGRKAVAVTYTLDNPELAYLDKDYEKFRETIDTALPDTLNSIVASNLDESLSIVLASSDRDPGSYYIYDVKAQTMKEIGARYPGIDPDKMAPMKRVDYEARDGLTVPAYLSLPPGAGEKDLPTIILPHGGPWARDSIQFDFLVQFLASRGYAVLQPNFRGSTGYGDRYEALGYGTWGRAMQDDISDGVKWLIDQGISDADRICIAGASYGGYAALMGLVKTPELYKCAAAFAPVTDIVRMLKEDGDYSTNDRNYRRVAGGLTKKELARISPIKHVKEFDTPLLIIHAEDDNVVPVRHSQRLVKELIKEKIPHRYVELEEGGHSLWDQDQRILWLTELETFLAEHLPVSGPTAPTVGGMEAKVEPAVDEITSADSKSEIKK